MPRISWRREISSFRSSDSSTWKIEELPIIEKELKCVQIFFVKMREILLKMREKMRQPKMSIFYCIFGRFRGGLLFNFFDLFFTILFLSYFTT